MVRQDQILVDFYRTLPRQGPGDDAATEQALLMTRLNLEDQLAVLDVECGTGAQTLKLATMLPNSDIIATDHRKEFLRELDIKKLSIRGGKIHTLLSPMYDLPIEDEALDLIWSEGSTASLGFRQAINYWGKFLKVGGFIVISELSWLTTHRPAELEDFWVSEYPEMSTIAQKLSQIERSGFKPVGHFVLPERGWTDNYYDPIIERTGPFLNENKRINGTVDIVKEILKEINMYHRYNGYYGHVYYIMQKCTST